MSIITQISTRMQLLCNCRAFTLDQLDSVDSHLTALRSEKDGSLISYILSSTDFIKQFEDQNPNYSWDAIMVCNSKS